MTPEDTEEKLVYELSVLLRKVQASEELIHKAERYFDEHHDEWLRDMPGFVSHFQDVIERKRELIDYEWHRIDTLGQAIAANRDPSRLDI